MTLSTLTPAAPPLAPPFEVETDPLRQAALDWVNEVRGVLGREPLNELVPGAMHEARNCPLFNSMSYGGPRLEGGVYHDTTLWTGGMRGHGPAAVNESTPFGAYAFLRAFDRGAYRDLVLR